MWANRSDWDSRPQGEPEKEPMGERMQYGPDYRRAA